MKQVLRKGLKEIVVDEVPDPVATPHHVVVRPFYSLISSGTETASLHQEGLLKEVAEHPSHLEKIWAAMRTAGPARTFEEVKAKFSEYAVLGYSGAGVVVEKHPSVTSLEIGQRVSYGGEGTGHGESVLTGRNLVARVPDSVSLRDASFATLGAIALNAVRVGAAGVGDFVAVIGLGLVGQLVAQLARVQGSVVIGCDLRSERVELARNLGAQHGVPAGSSLKDAIRAVTDGRGVDCAIVAAAAKSPAPVQSALEITRERGRIVVVGAVEINLPWQEMYLKEIQLLMARAYGPGSYDAAYEKRGQDYPYGYVRWTENRNMEEFLRLVGEGQVKVAPLVTHEFPLEQAPRAYQTILEPGSGSLAVVLKYPAADSPEPLLEYRPVRKVTAAPAVERKRFGVALAGAGNIARWAHLPALRRIPDARLHAVYSSAGARGKSYARRFGAAYCCTEFEAILRDPEVQVVLIASRNQDHAPQALAALEAGKHVLVEKPMALTEEECRRLHQTVERTGRLLAVGFNRRFATFCQDLKRQVRQRTGPAVVSCRVNSPGISGDYWMADPAAGGAILGEACHFVDLMYWLLEAEPVSVFAYSLPAGKKEPVGENNLAASFRFADGSIGNLTYCTVGSKASGGERIEVFAPGLAGITEDFKRLSLRTGTRREKSKWFPEKGYDAQMSAFFYSLREGVPVEPDVRDGSRATLACLKMLESARTHRECAIDLAALLGS